MSSTQVESVLSFFMLPERLDPNSIPASYLIKIWEAMANAAKSSVAPVTVSFHDLYKTMKTARGWIIRIKATNEIHVIFRSRVNDELFSNLNNPDFYLLAYLPIEVNSTLKLKRKPRTKKTKSTTVEDSFDERTNT